MKTARIVASLVAAIALTWLAHPASAATRTYYIAAEPVVWNYAPTGRNVIAGKTLPPLAATQMGWIYRKLVYRGYTNATFSKSLPRPAGEAYLGLFGPPIHAEVGDTIVVVFKNRTSEAMSLQTTGLIGARGAKIPPGQSHTYRWHVTDDDGPGPADLSSVLHAYVSLATNVPSAISAGLEGPIVITRRGSARADGSPVDVDREIFVAFRETHETESLLLADNLADPRINHRKVAKSGATLDPDNTIFNLNGFVYGNMPMMTMKRGERVRWYLIATATSFDFHAPTWTGQTVLAAGHRVDGVGLNPATRLVADMVPDNPGVWLFYCTLNIHLQGGMIARYTVEQ